jgi:hypothetical protein
MKKILVLILVFNKDNIFYKEFNVLDKQKLYLNELPDQTKDFNLNYDPILERASISILITESQYYYFSNVRIFLFNNNSFSKTLKYM